MKLRFGIIGLGNISKRVAKGIINSEYASLYACASRDFNKTLKFANEFNVRVAHKSYEDLFKDENVDVVYICTINKTHNELIKRAIDANKHVLCEKPLAKDEAEAKELYDYAKSHNRFLMEAQKAVFTKLNYNIHNLIKSGTIGKIKNIKASYCMRADFEKETTLLDKEYGGVLKDIGCYPLSYIEYMIVSEISEINVIDMKWHEDVDIECLINGKFKNGTNFEMECSFLNNKSNYAIIEGSLGSIICENFWKNDRATLTLSNMETEITYPHISEFSHEIDHMCICILNGFIKSVIYGDKESINLYRMIDYIKKEGEKFK